MTGQATARGTPWCAWLPGKFDINIWGFFLFTSSIVYSTELYCPFFSFFFFFFFFFFTFRCTLSIVRFFPLSFSFLLLLFCFPLFLFFYQLLWFCVFVFCFAFCVLLSLVLFFSSRLCNFQNQHFLDTFIF